MRTSKYLGKQFGEYTCTFSGVERVQPVYTQKRDAAGKRIRSKRPGTRLYYYLLERITSDQIANKIVRLNAAQMLKVSRGLCTVEDFANKFKNKNSDKPTERVCYSFCD
jgi:2,4-dienoyl-CoA reductase-like NADH-dependent reductase (Old Yellow Enzyme family)